MPGIEGRHFASTANSQESESGLKAKGCDTTSTNGDVRNFVCQTLINTLSRHNFSWMVRRSQLVLDEHWATQRSEIPHLKNYTLNTLGISIDLKWEERVTQPMRCPTFHNSMNIASSNEFEAITFSSQNNRNTAIKQSNYEIS